MGISGLATPTVAELLCYSPRPDQVVAIQGGRAILWSEFSSRVGGLCRELEKHPRGAALLFCADSYGFLTGLAALLATGWKVIVSPTGQTATSQRAALSLTLTVTDQSADLGMTTVHPLEQWSEGGSIPEFERFAPNITMLTSGSTGEPKQVQKSIAQLEQEAWGLEALWGNELGRATVFATVSHQHIYGMLFKVIWPFLAGRPFRAESVFYPEELLHELRNCRDALLISSPAYLKRLPEVVELGTLPSSLRQIFSSGGPLDSETAAQYCEVAQRQVIEVYGSTETGGIAWRAQPAGGLRWTPFPGVSWRVAPEENALEVNSELLQPSCQRLWYRTDDSALATEGGGFLLQGRLDRVVKIEEKRVSLVELEELLKRSPLVSDAAVVTISAGSRTSLGGAVALSDAGKRTLEKDGRKALCKALQEAVRSSVDPLHVPRRWRFVEVLPVNEQGKRAHLAIAGLFAEGGGKQPQVIWESLAQERCILRGRVPQDLVYFAGHFPEVPVVPGVVEIDWVMACLDKIAPNRGAVTTMENIKFHEVLRPGVEFSLELQWNDEKQQAAFVIADGDRKFSSGKISFQ